MPNPEDTITRIARDLDDKERVISDKLYSSKNIETWAIWAGRIAGGGILAYLGTIIAKLGKIIH